MKKYQYNAKILEVIDGDTVKLEIDLGFYIKFTVKGRLADINAPEGKQTESATWLRNQLPVGGIVGIESQKTQEKYGRWLVTIWHLDSNGVAITPSMNVSLVAEGLAEVWKK